MFLAGLVAPLVTGGSQATEAADFLCRWDITLAETGDTFRSSWLEVTESDGILSGKLLWRWGSVIKLKSAEVVGEELHAVRGEYYEDRPVDVVYRARLVDGKLVGSVKTPEGTVVRWTGIRSLEKSEVSGTWQLTGETPGRKITATLALSQKDGNVAGTYVTPGNREFPIEDGKLEGTKLTFSVPFQRPGQEAVSVSYSAEVRGDRLLGTARAEGRTAVLEFTAERQRKWSQPVQIFDGKSLAGWGPRDAKRRFGWSVREGAMVNAPPGDQDVVSEQQFRDFKLHVEFSLAERSNSGIYLRGRYELQLVDDYTRRPRTGVHGNCSIYSRIAPSANASKPANEWQTVEATLVGRWLTVVLNGETVMDNVHLDGITGGAVIPRGATINDEEAGGPLMFQGDHGLVRFRKVVVTPVAD
jgi:hypothetical protein